jgi:hypothetical protein
MEAVEIDMEVLRGGRDLATRLAEVLDAWQKMRPEKSFYSMTLEQFKEAVKPFTDALKEIADLESRVTHAVSKRDAATPKTRDLLQGVVNAVKGDASEGGEKGELYSAMGYIPISQRASGLVRRRKEESPNGGSSPQ